jgi:hypothetical protein
VARLQVFESSEQGHQALDFYAASDEEKRPAKAAKPLSRQQHEELHKELNFGGQGAFTAVAAEATCPQTSSVVLL